MHGSLIMKILVGNQAGEGLLAEHDLSLWIDAGTRRILLETGQGAALVKNARKLAGGLNQADILSFPGAFPPRGCPAATQGRETACRANTAAP